MLWLELLKGGTGNPYWLTQSYIVLVGVLWPLLMPFSLWMIEPERQHRNRMLAAIAVGAGIALFTLHAILQFPVTARIADYCIVYDYPVAQPHFMLMLYVIAACAAFFLSSDVAIVWLGVINMAAFGVTYYFYRYDLTSIWCFFAAVISGLIYVHFSYLHKNSAQRECRYGIL
jgi:hypothetical protein